MSTEKKDNESNKDLYKNIDTDGITSNKAGEQTIQTAETKILKSENSNDGKEILIGKNLDEVDEKKDGFDTLQRRILDKLQN